MKRAQAIRKVYTACALLTFNGLVVLVILNVVLYGVLGGYRLVTGNDLVDPVTEAYGGETLGQVYPDLSEEEIRQLLDETWSRPLMYEPFTQFREPEYSGTYVNVTAQGFRRSADQGPWPPDSSNLNVFVLGGSTTFGYGIADDQTVASRLQVHLSEALARPVKAYNFGRGFYYSAQERILLERLVLDGFTPDVAIFVDGLNEFYYPDGQPHYTRRLAEYLDRRARGEDSAESSWIKKLPMSQMIRAVRHARKRADDDSKAQASVRAFDAKYDDREILDGVIERYIANLRATRAFAQSYGFLPVFVWQPAPTYRYDLDSNPFYGSGYATHSYSHFGYGYFRDRLEQEPLGEGFLWCADLQESLKEPLYVDKYHYSGRMADLVAKDIVHRMQDQGLLDAFPKDRRRR